MEIVKGKKYVFKIDGRSYKGTATESLDYPDFASFIDVTAFQVPEVEVLPCCPSESTVVWVNMDKVTFIAEVQ